MIYSHPFFRKNKQKGVGSIVGSAFILLILLTGFSYYSMHVNNLITFNQIMHETQEMDLLQSLENLEIIEVLLTGENKLNITVQNSGSYQIHLIWLGLIDDSIGVAEYYEIDFYINPSETITDIRNENITMLEDEERNIQLITELGSLFTCSYPAYFETLSQSSISIVRMGSSYNPTQYELQGFTEHVGGSVLDLKKNEEVYLTFNSSNVISTCYYVDSSSSDIDGSPNRGLHSNFQAQRVGPDSMVDVLTETGKLVYTYRWVTPEGHMDPINEWSTEVYAYDNITETCSVNDIKKNKWSGYLDLTLSNPIECGKIRYYIGRETSSIDQVEIDVYNGAWVNVYSGVGTWDAWTNVSFTESSISQMRFRFENIAGVSTEAYIYEAEFLQTIETTHYGLDLEVQWTSVEFDELNEYLCIYGGNMGTEDIRVDVWYNSTWNNLFTDLSSGWNNVSVSSYLDSSTFTLRFKDFNDVTDISQDGWEIDASLVHIWGFSINHTAEVVITGASNTEDWSGLTFQVDSNWDIGAVWATIQLYNYNFSSYSTSGDGSISYISDAAPNTDELKNQTITLNTMDFRNSTGHWKIKMRGEKNTSSPFFMNVDWIDFKPRYESSDEYIQYGAWQEYRIRVRTANGDPIPYAILSIYSNGTVLSLRNAQTKETISNPDWLYLDVNGEYYLELKSTNITKETFELNVVIGSDLEKKIIIQEEK